LNAKRLGLRQSSGALKCRRHFPQSYVKGIIPKLLQVQLTPVRLDPCRKSGKKGSQSKTLTRDLATGDRATFLDGVCPLELLSTPIDIAPKST
jgi:hypothetical protein